jgi:methylated-DNA-[protein]-cysteine S-methyltransferase
VQGLHEGLAGQEKKIVVNGSIVQDSRNPGGSQQFPSLHQLETEKWAHETREPAMTDKHFTLFDTAIGICGIEWGPRGINGLQLPMGSDEKTRARIRQRHGDIVEAEPSAEVQGVIARIVELLAGKPDDLLDIALDLDGVPEFNRGVYDIARTIPPGKTMTYGDIAKKLGGVELSRDVGQALGRNPCPIVVPCHRVLAAGNKPGGFSARGGVDTKLKMLAIEGAPVNHTPSLFD